MATTEDQGCDLWLSRALLLALALLVGACHRDPIPSTLDDACMKLCEGLNCDGSEFGQDDLERCEAYCLEKARVTVEQGPVCEEAFENGMVCLADLSCPELIQWARDEPDAPCPTARSEVATACEGIYLEASALPP